MIRRLWPPARRWLRPVVARSWALSRAWYRLHGHELIGRPSDEIWYFAYGSNMHHSAFIARRRMQPRESRAGRLAGYRLRFNLEGRPLGKAAPANIAVDPTAEVWGVLYRISRRELLHLDRTEGVPGRNYRHLWIEVEDGNGGRVMAVAYIAQGKERDGYPSQRYLTLLREGARAHNLPAHWVTWLEGVPHAEGT